MQTENDTLKPEYSPQQEADGDCSAAICSDGWFLTGWQRKWTRTTGNDWYVARVYARFLYAEERYQRENKMGRYSLPNAIGEATPPELH